MYNTRTVRNPDSRICEVLAGLAAHHHRYWCYPSQAKICELLQRFTGRIMSRRTLNRHLAALERDGQIRRKRRHHRDPHRGMVLRSTLYTIAGRFLCRINRIVQAAARWRDRTTAATQALRVPEPAQYNKLSL